MMPKQTLLIVTILVAVVTGWLLFVGLPRWSGRSRQGAIAPGAASAGTSGRKIKAGLFYVAEDGQRLTRVERDVPYGENTVEQAKHILEAQIARVAEPLVSAVPEGTTLRSVFVTPQGDAFVDFSGEIVSHHSGGSTNEILTVYTIVDALCANLPAVQSVELLVDGKQIETLAGHVDLRRPLEKNLAWVQ